MVSTAQIYKKIDFLKSSQKIEVINYIDFLLSKEKKESYNKKPKFGCAKGRFKMSDDFDEPLEDLMEYMY
ncbi:MAG: DUF2281 domain-containing protein [Candidatus Kapabacteria bacterium]|nr:DUF2281 domain-containing protein [Candidatus Kapabacteria bacterium]